MTVLIYCDECCHLEHDRSNVMGLGAVWTERSNVRRLCSELVALKSEHRAEGELKWTKVSEARQAFYDAVIDWFFAEHALRFRALIVPNKRVLDHSKFNQGSHDAFYYKMYFSMLNRILSPTEKHEIYLDIKDSRSNVWVQKLREVLCNNVYDFTGETISRIQLPDPTNFN